MHYIHIFTSHHAFYDDVLRNKNKNRHAVFNLAHVSEICVISVKL